MTRRAWLVLVGACALLAASELVPWPHVAGHRSFAPALLLVVAVLALPRVCSVIALVVVVAVGFSLRPGWTSVAAPLVASLVLESSRRRAPLAGALVAGALYGALASAELPLHPLKLAAHAGFGALGALAGWALARKVSP